MADDLSLKIVIALTTKSLAPLSKQPSNAHKKQNKWRTKKLFTLNLYLPYRTG